MRQKSCVNSSISSQLRSVGSTPENNQIPETLSLQR